MDGILIELEQLIYRPDVIWLFLIVLATVTTNYGAKRLLLELQKQTTRTKTIWDDALVSSARRPLAWLIWVLGIGFAADVITADTGSTLAQLTDPVRFIAVIFLFTFFLYRFITEAEFAFIADGADRTTANAVGKLLRVSVVITAVLTVLQTLGVSVSGVLAFGGIGGIAVGFAAKDLLANFFGGLMVYLDRPFAVGDWIRSPDREIEGTVEEIGWRLTVIRTFDQRPLYIPNSVFATVSLENPSRMLNRRIHETIGLRYDDISKVQVIVDDVRQMLRTHPDIDADKTLMVNFNAFGASSLDFFVYTFTRTTDWVAYHGIKEHVLLRIYEIIEKHGAEIAFPSHTLYIEPEPQPSARC